jgi:predicted N-formylglutamate amidohydrolase
LEYAGHFDMQAGLMVTHRAYDIGILPVALRLADLLSAPIVFSTTTRLLIELNRSPGKPTWFSEFTRDLSPEVKDGIAERYYWPYRNHMQQLVQDAVAAGRVVTHLSMHSFTPVLDGQVREMHVGLLFDPDRPREQRFCEHWRKALSHELPDCTIAFNEPYAGKDDGVTTSLRGLVADPSYVGIEVEIRNDLLGDDASQRRWAEVLAETLPMV